MAAAADFRVRRPFAASRLLEHWEAVSRLTGPESTSARARLETAIGPELAGRLVLALARPRDSRAA